MNGIRNDHITEWQYFREQSSSSDNPSPLEAAEDGERIDE